MKTHKLLFIASGVLWIIWGLVHILAGVMTMGKVLEEDITGAVAGIADKIDPATLVANYPVASGAVIGQHGFNLFWIGVVTTICGVFVFRGKKNAIYLAAITGGLADLGYFLFMDLGGHINFVPGTVMTLVSASAIVLSLVALNQAKKAG